MNDILAMLNELRPEFDFESSDNFIEDGFLDSFDVVALSDMFEKKYKIVIDALNILPENFASLEAMINLIEKSGGAI